MTIKIKVANYVEQLLNFDADKVILGRENFDRMDFTEDFIIIDSIALGVPVARAESFDGDLEEQTFNARLMATFTVDFYGANAYQNAFSFSLLQGSQKNFELCRDLDLTMHSVSNITDLKSLEGTDQTDRIQLEVKIGYEETVTIETLRIDTVEIEFTNDKI